MGEQWMPKVICEYCGKEFNRPNAWLKGRKLHFCSRKCHSAWQVGKLKPNKCGNKHPRWKGGSSPRKFLKDGCELCGSKKNLLVHHKDKDRHNNNLSNLQTLCESCHNKVHNNVRNFKEAYKKLERDKYGRSKRQRENIPTSE